MDNVCRLYVRYYLLRIREIFDRKMSRKLLWGVYWETTQRVEDLRLKKEVSKYKSKEIRMGLRLCRTIMNHLINVEGGKR